MSESTTYISVEEIQKQIINMSPKKIRSFIHKYLPVKKIGKRLYVSREDFVSLLSDPDRCHFPLDANK